MEGFVYLFLIILTILVQNTFSREIQMKFKKPDNLLTSEKIQDNLEEKLYESDGM